MTNESIAPELLEILRCPYCVSSETRLPGDDPGRLTLVRDGQWLYSPESGYKYPIKEGIPVMLIEEGQKWKDTPLEELPDPGPLVDPAQFSQSDTPGRAISEHHGPDLQLYALAGLMFAIMLVLAIRLLRKK